MKKKKEEKVSGTVFLFLRTTLAAKGALKPQSTDHPITPRFMSEGASSGHATPKGR